MAVIVSMGCTGSIGASRDGLGPTDDRGLGAGGNGRGGGKGTAGAVNAGGAGAAVTFACNQGAAAVELPMRKLTTTQYRNTVKDLVTRVFAGDAAGAERVVGALAPWLSRMPDDERQVVPQDHLGAYRRMDQDLEQIHVDAAYDLAVTMGAALTQGAALGKVVGACAADTDAANDGPCLTDFIARFGLLALRRPPTEAETQHYRGVYGTDSRASAAAYADVIGALLMAPQFLYRVESGDAAVAAKADTYALTAYELASRLSYQFWDTMPDEALLEGARTGALVTPQGLAAQVDRMLADPRARVTMRDFFQDWLKLDRLPSVEARIGEPIFKTFAGTDVPSVTAAALLRTQMIDEILTLVGRVTFDDRGPGQGSLSTLYQDERVLVKGKEVARVYGVAPWDGVSEPQRFPAGQRPGLLTRAALHAYGSANTRPVMKGVFVRQSLLCDEVPPPPPDVAAAVMEPKLSPTQSTRQAVEAITEQPGTICVACHGTMINPIGYATENFDALGRFRTTQTLYDESGAVTGTVPIDTRSRPQIVAGDTAEVTGVAGLSQKILESGKVPACAARQYFRFTFGRWEVPASDGCALETLRRKAAGGGTFVSALREAALLPEFSQRYIPGGGP